MRIFQGLFLERCLECSRSFINLFECSRTFTKYFSMIQKVSGSFKIFKTFRIMKKKLMFLKRYQNCAKVFQSFCKILKKFPKCFRNSLKFLPNIIIYIYNISRMSEKSFSTIFQRMFNKIPKRMQIFQNNVIETSIAFKRL